MSMKKIILTIVRFIFNLSHCLGGHGNPPVFRKEAGFVEDDAADLRVWLCPASVGEDEPPQLRQAGCSVLLTESVPGKRERELL